MEMNMERKRCGDCIFYHGIHDDCGVCTLCETDETFDKTCDFVYACKKFQPKQLITRGDKIRQMSNEKLLDALKNLHQLFLWDKYKALAWLNSSDESDVDDFTCS